ncbi:MAG: histidinol-phosphate transaminase [Nitrosomonas sp.]|nr:histidinol-phosphate transaminase [Nitrosomonas sp.]
MSILLKNVIRPEIFELSAYHVPPAKGMIKLDAMENPYPLSLTLREEIAQLAENATINRYPDPTASVLKNILRKTLSVPDDMSILLGNGSDEIIQMIALAAAKPGAVLLGLDPGFAMFRIIATFSGMSYVGVPLNEDFSLNLEATLTAINRYQPSIIFLAYPNNPTGNLFDMQSIHQIIQEAPGIVIIDEAYHAFAGVSFMDQLAQFPNLLLMRTLSKLGLAGLRLGLLIGRSEWLEQFEKLRLPYNIGVMTQLIAEKVLQHYDDLLKQTTVIKTERSKLLSELSDLSGITTFPSEANFILFRTKRASEVYTELKQKGVLIKNLDGTNPLLKDCLRVTVGTPHENAQFYYALSQILENKNF